MTDYQPKPGDKVLLTLRAEVDGGGEYMIRWGGLGPDYSRVIVRVEPAPVEPAPVEPAPVEPPTGFAARIRATVHGIQGVRLVRADETFIPWYMHPRDMRDNALGMLWYADADLSDVEILYPGDPS